MDGWGYLEGWVDMHHIDKLNKGIQACVNLNTLHQMLQSSSSSCLKEGSIVPKPFLTGICLACSWKSSKIEIPQPH